MIIQLKDANASAMNLGQLQIPGQFDESALELFNNMTKYPVYSNDALCVNQLISDLKSNGLWSKIKLFYVPWMAANVDELEYNLQGMSMSVDKSNLYFQDGNLYAHTVAGGMTNVLCSIPDTDVKNSFVAMPIPSVDKGPGRVNQAAISNANGNLTLVAVSGPIQNFGIGKNYNFNNILSPSEIMLRGGVINISNSFNGVNPSDLSSFTVNGLQPVAKGSITAQTETKVNRIYLSKYFSQTDSPTNLWSDFFRPIYIIGNTVLSSSEVTTMVSILKKYSDNI